MNNMKTLIGLVAIAAIVLGIQAVRLLTREAPARHTGSEEAQVGRRLAELVDARTGSGEKVTVIVLFRRDVQPYQARIDTLAEALAADASVEVIYAVDDGIYDDDDYTVAIDAALNRVPGTRTLVVVGGGGVTHASVSAKLRAFLDSDGAFILNGATHESSDFVKLTEKGQVTILARRTTWLRPSPEGPVDAAIPYVDRHYVLLPGEG